MAEIVYLLCALTSLSCTFLLLKGYFKTKTPLLLWSGICFLCLALNNILLFVDLALVTEIDLLPYRNSLVLTGLLVLIRALVFGII